MAERTCSNVGCDEPHYGKGLCKGCYMRAWRAAKAQHLAEYRKRHYVENAEYYRRKARAWRADRPDQVAANNAAWAAKNPDYRAEYYRATIDQNRAYKAARRAADLDAVRAYARAAQARRRAMKRAAAGTATVEQIAARVAVWGHRCWMCRGDWEAMDHVKPLAKGGSNWPANLRPICGPCNSRKRDTWPLAA